MNEFIPPFEFQRVFIQPWTEAFSSTIWIAIMGFCIATACGLVGNYLILRRMALVGDAISHSVLPGLAIAFLLSKSRSSFAMFLGALAAAVVTTLLIEIIHKKSRIKHDSAIGITFTSLFAVGVILISLFSAQVDLDQECVLYGEIMWVPLEQMVAVGGTTLGPEPVLRMASVALITVGLIALFYKELLASSFDPGLASSLGINAALVHYGLMCWLAIVVVSAFESVGAILVIAMLILPGATASLLSFRLPRIMCLTVLHGALSTLMGIHLAYWLNCSMSPAMIVTGSLLFITAWVLSPTQGLLGRWLRRSRADRETPPEMAPAGQM